MSKFKRKTQKEILRALGDISKHSPDDQKLLDCTISETMKKIPLPKSGDWLREHKETGQSLKQFNRFVMSAHPHATFKTIYVQPLGNFSKDNKRIVPLGVLKEYLEVFFDGLEAEILKPYTLEQAKKVVDITTRDIEDDNITQLLTSDVLAFLEKTKKIDSEKFRKDKLRRMRKGEKKSTAKDRLRTEVCSIVVCHPYDLFPSFEWNYVFGIARIMDCIGCYSFCRLDPDFPVLDEDSQPSKSEYLLILKRSLKILTHELGHLFAMKHCVHFHCLMNGSNHQKESDSAPLFLCSVCLHKYLDRMKKTMKGDLLERYIRMHQFFTKYGLLVQSKWIEDRVKEVGLNLKGKKKKKKVEKKKISGKGFKKGKGFKL